MSIDLLSILDRMGFSSFASGFLTGIILGLIIAAAATGYIFYYFHKVYIPRLSLAKGKDKIKILNKITEEIEELKSLFSDVHDIRDEDFSVIINQSIHILSIKKRKILAKAINKIKADKQQAKNLDIIHDLFFTS